PKDHLIAYVNHWGELGSYNDLVFEANQSKLENLNRSADLGFDIDDDDLADIKDEYSDKLDEAFEILGDRFNQQEKNIKEANQDDKEKRVREIEQADIAYRSLFQAVLSGSAESKDIDGWISRLIVVDNSKTGEERDKERKNVLDDKDDVKKAIRLAQAYHLKKAQNGRGIFISSVSFAGEKFTSAVNAIVVLDFKSLKVQGIDSIRGFCWIITCHPIFAIFLILLTLCTWSLFGGAICRMAAVQFARDDRLGPIPALRFSLSRMLSLIIAPLTPIAFIGMVSLLILAGGFVAAIPAIGEIMAGLLFPLALIAGIFIALAIIGLVAGVNLMYPTIAVEGSESLDSLSRSFSYVYTKPWRMGFYTALAVGYGAVCYLFVRLFAFLLLMSVRIPLVSMNLDSSSAGDVRGKLDAIWPAPDFGHLHPNINYMALGFSESIGAFFIWFWVVIVSCIVLAFVISFFFSANTVIYFLMRKQVDRTDYEEVFFEEDPDELPPLETDETVSDQEESPKKDEPSSDTEETEKPKKPKKPRKPRKKTTDEDSSSDDSDGSEGEK
ncbi:MAG: hypothetical protein IID32_10645, partial [Planctomycetes bacterium]|nr:hypothetical protein [Planctomycetota bacterium]